VIRTQVQLTEEQAHAVKRVAAQRGLSMAEVLRQLVDAHLMGSPHSDQLERAARVIGRHRSGRGDVSQEHDRDLSEAFTR
jgi:hypothetical protein